MRRYLWPLLLPVFALALGAGVAMWRGAPVYRVAGPSMAPTLRGPHYVLTCQRCRFPAAIDATTRLPEEVPCPNCSYQHNRAEKAELRPGEVLAWHRATLADLQRWDLVVVDDPRTPGQAVVKRVAFLPGEKPLICRGELYVDGQIVVKSPEERTAMRILMFDQNFDLPDHPRFQPERAEQSGWQVTPGHLHYQPLGQAEENGADWLIYHHRHGVPPPGPADVDVRPMDVDSYNPSLSRELFPVSDLWLSWYCEAWTASALTLKLQDETTPGTIRIDVETGFVEAERKGSVRRLPLEVTTLAGLTVEAGICDRRWFVHLRQNGETWDFPLIEGPIRFGERPFALQVEGGSASFKDVRLYRDIFWLGAHQREQAWSPEARLEEHEIFLLGDNPPVSEDSRYTLGPIDTHTHLRGKVRLKADRADGR